MTQPSFKNRTWIVAEPTAASVRALQQAGGLGLQEAQVLAGRGIAPTELADFLDPKIRTAMPNPSFFQDMDKAAERLAKAIIGEETIAIWSDYDVDGACSAAILGRFLRAQGVRNVLIHIPDRIHEGYGPNTPGLKALQDKGATLVCVLDSGTTAFEPLADAAAMGLDVIVIDHHMAEETLPEAVALVNPNRLDQEPGFGHVCAAGMVFFFVVATNTLLRRFGRPNVPVMPLVALVSLATVCDIVALRTINRAFVAQGLPRLSERVYPGVEALAKAAGVEAGIDVGVCGFGLGPRINAGGRIGASDLGTRLLMTDDPVEAHALAIQLDTLNRERRDMERQSTDEAIAQLRDRFIPGVTRALALAIVEGHEGVVGISAARVKEAFDAPAFVLAYAENGLLKGSGRSVTGFDLGAAVVAARQQGLLVKGGGHAMAAGITIEPDKVEAFIAFVNAAIDQSAYARDGLPLHADGVVRANALTVGWVEGLDKLGPFGMGHPTPRFLLTNVKIVDTRILKDKATGADKHLKLRLQDASGKGPRFDAPLWSACGTPLQEVFANAGDAPLDLVCAMEINEWNNARSVQLRIEDARLCAPQTVVEEEDVAVPF